MSDSSRDTGRDDTPSVHCSRCGTVRDERTPAAEALAWASERDSARGVLLWLCPACARSHARDIEGRLPHEYW